MTVRRALSILTLLALLALAGCASGTSTAPTPTTPAASTTPTPTATPVPNSHSLELTFLGSDGNVWEMTWPGGTPRQWTTDAQAGQVRYSGLAWSPSGSQLAVLRETGPLGNPTSDTLILFAPDGSIASKYTLIGQPYNTPFAWAPDETQIAYRTTTNQFDPMTGDIKGQLNILSLNAQAAKSTLLYDDGGGGCGGAFSPLLAAMMAAHNAYQGIDTFTWTPDQQGILLSRGCGNDSASLVDLGTQKTTAGYPAGASYQPGGRPVMLGLWNQNNKSTLGLGNATGKELRVLFSATFLAKYAIVLGEATWSSDGQNIYFEHNNGIWMMDANGSYAHQVVAGATNDARQQATVAMLPRLSPDGSLLLYLQLHGANGGPGSGSVTAQCYVAHADGSNATPLPQGATEAVWRPVK